MSLARLKDFEASKICVIKPSALGDVVQALPLLEPLQARFPGAEISWVINRGLSGLLADHPHLHEIIPFDRRGGLLSSLRLLLRLHAARFDLVIDLQGLLRSAIMCCATRAGLRIGLQTAREGAGYAWHATLPESGRLIPAHQRYWRVAEALGVGDRPRQLQLSIADEDRATGTRALAELPRPWVAMHPGARWETKRWPSEKFAAVARSLITDYGAGVILLGSGDELPLTEEVERLIGRPNGTSRLQLRNLAGKTTLKQLAAILQSADLAVSNDSGPMHLAAELGTPVVGIFTCTDPVRSGPPGELHALVSTAVPCAGSYCKFCPHHGADHLACFHELTVERVLAAIRMIMERERSTLRIA